jgi:hypothetical protein
VEGSESQGVGFKNPVKSIEAIEEGAGKAGGGRGREKQEQQLEPKAHQMA